MKDYDFEEGLIDLTAPKGDIYKKLDMIISSKYGIAIKKRINKKASEFKKQSEKMWEKVFSILIK